VRRTFNAFSCGGWAECLLAAIRNSPIRSSGLVTGCGAAPRADAGSISVTGFVMSSPSHEHKWIEDRTAHQADNKVLTHQTPPGLLLPQAPPGTG
jgi:hypothetical protein